MAVAIGAAALVLGTSADAVEAGNSGPETFEELAALPFVEATGPKTALVDFTSDPEVAAKALAAFATATDGVTIQVIGVTVPTPEERRRLDEAATANDPVRAVSSPSCAALEGGSRQPAVTIPHLGCDPESAEEKLGSPVLGDAALAVPEALQSVVNFMLPSEKEATALTASFEGGHLAVDLSASVGEAMLQLPVDDRVAVDRALTATARSNADVRSVAFTVGGDCLLYALASGGDVCAVNDFSLGASTEGID